MKYLCNYNTGEKAFLLATLLVMVSVAMAQQSFIFMETLRWFKGCSLFPCSLNC